MSYACSKKLLSEREEYYYKKEYFMCVLQAPSEEQRDTPGCVLLDSSLIFQSKLKKYSIKVIECGSYKSVYFYENIKTKEIKEREKQKEDYKEKKEKEKEHLINRMFNDTDLTSTERKKNLTVGEIEEKNINRSKIKMQRLIKTNIDDFKTFITLTFDSNKTDIDINDIELANSKFNIFRTYMKQLKSDFKCVGVPEFQKRGAVHYHLLTNIDYEDLVLLDNEIRTYNKKSKSYKVGKPLKVWSYGYSLAIPLIGINIVAYMSKYMTKDIDNRLFSKKRYFYTRNLKLPSEYYIDLDNQEEVLYYLKSLNDFKECYKKEYYDKFNNKVLFVEYSSLNGSYN